MRDLDDGPSLRSVFTKPELPPQPIRLEHRVLLLPAGRALNVGALRDEAGATQQLVIGVGYSAESPLHSLACGVTFPVAVLPALCKVLSELTATASDPKAGRLRDASTCICTNPDSRFCTGRVDGSCPCACHVTETSR
jgi:hypothetical protein